MAVTVKNVHRPFVAARGTSGGDTLALAQYLRVVADPEGNDRREVVLQVDEATYAGVIAEYVTGAATTILDASIDTEYAAADTDERELSSTQVTNTIDKEIS